MIANPTPKVYTMTHSERETKWEATVFVDNRPASDHVSYRITPQRGPYGTMFAEDAFKAAAALELYEALQAAIDCGVIPKSSAMDGGANRHSEQVRVADMCRAAIAKARGES